MKCPRCLREISSLVETDRDYCCQYCVDFSGEEIVEEWGIERIAPAYVEKPKQDFKLSGDIVCASCGDSFSKKNPKVKARSGGDLCKDCAGRSYKQNSKDNLRNRQFGGPSHF